MSVRFTSAQRGLLFVAFQGVAPGGHSGCPNCSPNSDHADIIECDRWRVSELTVRDVDYASDWLSQERTELCAEATWGSKTSNEIDFAWGQRNKAIDNTLDKLRRLRAGLRAKEEA